MAASMMSTSALASGGNLATIGNYGVVATLQSIGATGALPATLAAGAMVAGGLGGFALFKAGSYVYRKYYNTD